jgi:aspartyl-tRNA(Asn)/glutamyl-tRNA(Gln) amidotransferase subunit C
VSRFSPDDIDRVAALAHLQLTDEARARLGADLAQILDYVDRLQAVPTEGVPLTSHIVEGAGDWRPDQPQPSLSVHDALANATDANEASGLFRVPRVIGA